MRRILLNKTAGGEEAWSLNDHTSGPTEEVRNDVNVATRDCSTGFTTYMCEIVSREFMRKKKTAEYGDASQYGMGTLAGYGKRSGVVYIETKMPLNHAKYTVASGEWNKYGWIGGAEGCNPSPRSHPP